LAARAQRQHPVGFRNFVPGLPHPRISLIL
jgi:hypothetical protein